MKAIFEGVYPVLPTPLRVDQSPDLEGLCTLADYYISKKVHGLVLLGSGGEFPYFSIEEKREIIKTVMAVVKGQVPVITGTGAHSAREAAALSDYAAGCGVAGFLTAVPTYYPVAFGDVYEYFSMLSKAVKTPILYYHFPETTKLRLSPEEIALICEIDGVVGIKESILNLREVRRHISGIKKKPFSVMSGTSFMFLEILRMGGTGVICPVPLVIPEIMVELYMSFVRGDLSRAEDLEKVVYKTLPLLSDLPIPPGIARILLKTCARLGIPLKAGGTAIQATFKEALRQKGLSISPLVRTPLRQIDDKRRKVVEKVLKSLR